jgi:endoglycosylceramidase
MTQKSTILFVVIALFLISLDAKDVNLKNGKLYDSKNRELTLHGTNVVVKTPPYIPTIGEYNSVSSFGPEDIKNLKENGFNAIRLGVMWAGVEPNKNGFNETYLQEMVKIVNMAG